MSGRLKLAIGAAVVAVLAIAGVVAAGQFRAEEPVEKPARAQDESRENVRPLGKRLELGKVAKISPNYSVAVTELTLYEGEKSQFLAATVKAEYIGTDEGEPWADLSVEFVDADRRTSAESSCPSGVGGESDEAALTVGDVTTHVACMALPSRVVKGGRVIVEEALQKGDRVSWSTDEVVTKEIPSPAPEPLGGRDRVTEFRAPSGGSGGSSNKDVCEEYEDDVEEYRDGIDELSDIADRYRDDPDREDEVEEFDEWKEEMDKNVERYEAAC